MRRLEGLRMRVVVGIDLRAVEHDWLVERSALYAKRLGVRLDFVYCAGGAETPEMRSRLEGLLARIPEEYRGRALVLPEGPADGLVALSKEVDMLVVGSREPLAIDRLLRGPMASRVLKHAHCPVLVPRGERAPSVNPRLLVGVDVEGPAPTAVLKWADRWAEHLNGTVHILYAAQTHRGDFAQTKDAIQAQLEAMLAAHVG
ncbi:MAG: universal stress protein, partial [Myxococcales bacterium]|nr:universal stress protein [Myxococcales bacterium]